MYTVFCYRILFCLDPDPYRFCLDLDQSSGWIRILNFSDLDLDPDLDLLFSGHWSVASVKIYIFENLQRPKKFSVLNLRCAYCRVVNPDLRVLVMLRYSNQCWRSKYIEFGSGSRILAQFGSGSRVIQSNFKEKFILILEKNNFLTYIFMC